MQWTLRFHPAVKKDLRRFPHEARDFIMKNILLVIAEDPYRGESLHGPLKGFWKYSLGEHRIAYVMDEKQKDIIILEIGPRGGFYERLRRRLRK